MSFRFALFQEHAILRVSPNCYPEGLLRQTSPATDQELKTDPESSTELNDFSAYLAHEVWSTPLAFIDASYETKSRIPDDLDSIPLDSTPVSFIDTLILYGIASDIEGAHSFLRKALADYVNYACAPPPVWSSTRTKECEICEREIPLTYHHCPAGNPYQVCSTLWLGYTCHTAVHQVATNEELAQHYYSVDLLLQREDIRRWGKYASKQRFGVRRG
ncbi:hypothetical protein B0H12DRAFT_1075341 [Mycena haematopus]|nr:hypothetical protein B0H12DRAFT_1075341 [Mycena haematopus]